ncbi:O-antigen ligase family protein [Mesorhizobium sp. KR1-2]|uniref:O-antigen ligase family protein n=1 Tax=Mesorhizobium sp. KR1-2 TaxID=3156609 RepID=UPI0032B3B4E5
MLKLKGEWPKYLLGLAFIAAALLGGGAAPRLWTDTVLQLFILLAATPILAARSGEAADVRIFWLCGLVLVAIIVQLLPVSEGLVRPLRSEVFSNSRLDSGTLEFISLGLGRTLESLLYVAVLTILLVALLRVPGPQLHALLPFLLAGVACNAIAGFVQHSASARVTVEGLLPFTVTAGFFANRNHFASLLYEALPFLLYLATFAGMRPWAGAAIVLLLLDLLATGSRAGAVIGLLALVLSVVFFASRSRAGIGSLVVLAAVAGVYGMGTWFVLEARDFTDATRAQLAATTLQGIRQNWALGVGFGNFPAAYQAYEDPSTISGRYANHAHNDYLELIFEGGVMAALLIAGYVAMIGAQLLRIRHSHFHKAAFLGVLFVLIHSSVDYPLRTMAIAVPFVYFNAILFHGGLKPAGRHIKGIVEVTNGRRRRRVPVTAA